MLDAAAFASCSKGMAGPAAKRAAVSHLQAIISLSERRACSIVGTDRKMIPYRSSRRADAVLRGRLRDLASSGGVSATAGCSSCCGGRASHKDQLDLPALSGGRAHDPQAAAGLPEGGGDRASIFVETRPKAR